MIGMHVHGQLNLSHVSYNTYIGSHPAKVWGLKIKAFPCNPLGAIPIMVGLYDGKASLWMQF